MTTQQATQTQLTIDDFLPAPGDPPSPSPASAPTPRTSALWDAPPKRYVRHDAMETSRRAIAPEAVPDRALKGTRLAVYRAIRKAGARGLTDEEVAERLGGNPATARARRVELKGMGFVRDSGQRRLTHWGGEAAAWVAVPQEREQGQAGSEGEGEVA